MSSRTLNLDKVRRILRFSVKFARAMSDHSDLFKSQDIAEFYLKYRPTYGPEIYNTIVSFCKESSTDSELSLAIDVGCGSGQSTLPLTRHFKKVIGQDVSEAQISKAPTHISDLSFRVGPAQDLTFADKESVDLVTVAQAMHWMDTQRLYSEVQRVLKPGGAFVAYGYGMPVLDEAKAQETVLHFHTDVLGPYWSDGRNLVEEHYQSYSLPFPGWRRNDSLKIERTWTVDDFVGYLCSWSAYQKYLMANPLDDTMAVVRHKLQEVYQKDKEVGSDLDVKVTWPVFMLMGHKPRD